jgi:hypothetical protein
MIGEHRARAGRQLALAACSTEHSADFGNPSVAHLRESLQASMLEVPRESSRIDAVGRSTGADARRVAPASPIDQKSIWTPKRR